MRKLTLAEKIESLERVSRMLRALRNGVPWCVVSAEFKPTTTEVRMVNRRLKKDGVRPDR